MLLLLSMSNECISKHEITQFDRSTHIGVSLHIQIYYHVITLIVVRDSQHKQNKIRACLEASALTMLTICFLNQQFDNEHLVLMCGACILHAGSLMFCFVCMCVQFIYNFCFYHNNIFHYSLAYARELCNIITVHLNRSTEQ